MSMAATMKRRASNGILVGALTVIATLASPIAQLAIFGGFTAYLATMATAGSPIAISCWIATAVAVAAAVHLVTARRQPDEGMLPTNTSAIALALVQMVALTSMWLMLAPDSLMTRIVILLFAALTAFDVVDRILLVVRMRRQGGVVAEAKRIVDRIVRDHPEDAHSLIAQENVKRRGRSRLHWRLGEALSAENVALYEREHAERDAEGKTMQVHYFTIVATGPDPDQDEIYNAIYEAGCDDSVAGSCGGLFEIAFHREAASFAEAVASARADIAKTPLHVIRLVRDHHGEDQPTPEEAAVLAEANASLGDAYVPGPENAA